MTNKPSIMTRIATGQNVFKAAQKRIERIFDEFDNIVVGYSGGKDSTVTLEMTLMEARKRGRLPLKVMFLDQEVELAATISMVREVMNRDEVEPLWLQIPFTLSNNTSANSVWLKCWDEENEDKWMRPKEDISIKENVFNCERFGDMFKAVADYYYPEEKMCYVAGVRTEESAMRLMGLTGSLTYKDITWGKILDKTRDHYTFYPLYDWRYTDIWKAIHDHDWKYCSIYDDQYRHGVSVNNMRVSSLTHESSLKSIYKLQELEKDTYDKLCQRIDGIHMTSKLAGDAYSCPKELPSAFVSWVEYRDYLLENLLPEKWHKKFRDKFESMRKKWPDETKTYRMQISSILHNDYEFVKLQSKPQSKKDYDAYKQRRKDEKLST